VVGVVLIEYNMTSGMMVHSFADTDLRSERIHLDPVASWEILAASLQMDRSSLAGIHFAAVARMAMVVVVEEDMGVGAVVFHLVWVVVEAVGRMGLNLHLKGLGKHFDLHSSLFHNEGNICWSMVEDMLVGTLLPNQRMTETYLRGHHHNSQVYTQDNTWANMSCYKLQGAKRETEVVGCCVPPGSAVYNT